MRVCFVNDCDFLGGGEIWVLRACRHLGSAGAYTCVVCPVGSALERVCERQAIDVFPVLGRPLGDETVHERLYRVLRDQAIDLVYCTVIGNLCEARLLEQVASRINGERSRDKLAVILKTGLAPRDALAPAHYGAGSGPVVRRLHVVAAHSRQAFRAWLPVPNDSFVEVVDEGADLARDVPDAPGRMAAKERLNVAGRRVVLCAARMVDGMKGQSVLLRAAAGVRAVFPDVVYLMAGDGPDRALLEELRDDLALADAVRFLGHIDDMPALFAASDVFCHPSLDDGLPNAIVEAMSMSLSVVASRVGAIPEVVQHQHTGLLVRPNDVADLRDALVALLAHDEERAAMGRRGRASLRDRYDLHANFDRLLRRLEDELEDFRAEPAARTAPPASASAEIVPVLFVMSVIRTGGEETELGILASHLDRRRYPMSVLVLAESEEAAPVLDELDAWQVPIDRRCARMQEESERIRHVVGRIRSERIGIVVVCQDASFAYRVFGHLQPDECRLIEHGGIVSDVAAVPKDRTARYVGVSSQITRAAAASMADRTHAVWIPSMVDVARYDDPAWSEARAGTALWLRHAVLAPHGYPDRACVVVFVGRLDARKRVDDFIAAARQLEQRCPEALFLVVGGPDAYQPDHASQLLRAADDLVERHRVVFAGARGDVPGLLAAADILVLPSVGEGMAHVINEAGAAGLAVIASDDGAACEQLENGRCGALFEPFDVERLSLLIEALARDPARRAMLGTRLREKVRAEYAATVVIDRWHALFADVTCELGNRVRRANGRLPHAQAGDR